MNAPSSHSPKRLCLLGSTGSIGTQALEICAQFPERYQVHSLAAGKNVDRLLEQIRQFQPTYVSVSDEATRKKLREALDEASLENPPQEILTTEAGGLNALARDDNVDDVLMGVVGVLGLGPSLAALQAGKRLLTANKETFVAGGHLVQPYLSQVLPFDSEHNALFQCIHGEPRRHVRNLWLTASGGAFRDWPLKDFENITPEDALKHPNWVMGKKVTVDSATLMNKGLELIEAHWLFGVESANLKVLVHPQSVVHSMVEFVDGSILAQLGPADMRIPIQVAMAWPERWAGDYMGTHLDLSALSALNFEPPDAERFPCLGLARQALEAGPIATCVLNTADEVAVEAFLAGKLAFTKIAPLIEQTLEAAAKDYSLAMAPDLEGILALDAWTRRTASALI